MSKADYPAGWDEERVRRVLAHYESQSDEDAAAEDDAAFEHAGQTTMEVPSELVPAIREMIARYELSRRDMPPATDAGERGS